MKIKVIAALVVVVIASIVVPSSLVLGSPNEDGFQAANGVSAAPFPVNTHRYDPYKNYKFGVKWDGQYIWGIHKVTGLTRSTEALDDRQGLDPAIDRIMPGITRYEPIVLERGVTQDRSFEQWANLVFQYGNSPEQTPTEYRKNIIIDLFNEAGQLVMSWHVYRAWPSEYSALEVLDANDGDIAIERLTLQHEGWERDTGVPEPVEP